MGAFASLIGVAVALLSSFEPASNEDPSSNLVNAFERYCLTPDGDHEFTWALARTDNFEALTEEEFPGLRLPGASQLRGFRRVVDGHETKVLTSVNSESGPAGLAYYRRCFVSMSNADQEDVNRELESLIGTRRFRMEQTLVYAWIPLADGTNRPVSRKDFVENYARLSASQGLRYITNRALDGQVFLGYATPRDEATYRLPY